MLSFSMVHRWFWWNNPISPRRPGIWLQDAPRLFTFSLILCNLLGPTSPEYLNYPSIVRHLVAKSKQCKARISCILYNFIQFFNIFWCRHAQVKKSNHLFPSIFHSNAFKSSFGSIHSHLKCLRWSFSLSGYQLFDFDGIFVGRDWMGPRSGGFATPGAWRDRG